MATLRRKRAALFIALVLGSSGCSLFLDFDLTGNAPKAGSNEGGAPPTSGSDSGGALLDAGDDGAPIPPPFGDFQCGDTFDLCDGFEDRTTPVGGIFTRMLGGGDGLGFTTRRPASNKQALEVVRPFSAAPDDSFLASENNPLPEGKGKITLQVIIQIENGTVAQERTLVLIRPAATIDAAGEPRVKLLVRPTGIFIEARKFDGAGAWFSSKIEGPAIANGAYHTLQIDVHFGQGDLVVNLDGPEVFNQPGLMLLDGPLGTSYSFALGASSQSNGAGAMTARFDNVRLRHR